jgi:hypothetical protein
MKLITEKGVRFLKRFDDEEYPRRAGSLCWLPSELAERLIEQGITRPPNTQDERDKLETLKEAEMLMNQALSGLSA